ncbi:substrate import-associated zinc metallohydrolase lipoprotein [Aquimarina sp. 2304DJ70-9]|uniref:substrate import-associated zinc metallohydrolase lipoprotein n=1 Tax=Aquimarina penaris TaxID=3231044 RepID=UPI0034636C0D
MKTQNIIVQKILLLLVSLSILSGCEREETLKPTPIFEAGIEESTTELDQFLKTEFRDPYGSVIIYKFVDRYIDPSKSAVPPRLEVVRPVAELIKQAWIEPYNKASNQGQEFLRQYFPGEIVILGSPIFNSNGTITLGIADSGVRVTLTQANEYAPGNTDWIIQTFRTLHHEFAHIVDQNFNFDVESFYEISGDDYTSPNTWTSLIENGSEESTTSIENAIKRGMVTPYGTSAVGEDFAEIIARIITTDPMVFEATYLTPEDCSGQGQDCLDRNEGRARIQQKYDAVVKYMQDDVGIDLFVLRDEFLKSIN